MEKAQHLKDKFQLEKKKARELRLKQTSKTNTAKEFVNYDVSALYSDEEDLDNGLCKTLGNKSNIFLP